MILKDFNNQVHWNPLDAATDVVYLAGQPTPGIAEVVGASSPRKWDERAGYALSGAVVVFHGLGLSHFEIRLRLYTADDWEAWHKFRPIVERIPRSFMGNGGGNGAIDIVHPITAALGIKAVCVEELLQPDQTADGEWTIGIKVIEFRVPVFAVAKAEGSASTADPEDARLRQIGADLKGHGVDFLGDAALDALTSHQP